MIPPLLAVLSWPLISIFFFKRFSPAVAVLLTLVGGFLLLPVRGSLDLPVLPSLSKTSVPSLTAFVIGAAILSSRMKEFAPGSIQPGWLPQNKLILGLLACVVIGPFLTVIFNGDRLVYGPTVLQGLRLYDGFSIVMRSFVLVLPFLLARKYLARPEDHKTVLLVFCFAGLAYSLPTLLEVRISPKINVLVYGFFAHDWHQHVRGGHYRPLVFLKHGLWLGIFMAATVVAAAICWRMMKGSRTKFLLAVCWLFVTLYLARTLGAFLIVLMILPVALFLTVRLQLIFAGVLACVVLLYPMLRGSGFIPTERAVSMAEKINPERARSLAFRLTHEDKLLEKANKRPIWGWGSWGRNRVYNEQGRDVSVTDGSWIIAIGSYGWVGYIGRFGLFTLPIILFAFSRRRSDVTLATSGLCLVMIVNLIDVIPNSSLTPLTWMVAGALAGRLELRAGQRSEDDVPELVKTGSHGPRYSRPVRGGSPTRGRRPTEVDLPDGSARPDRPGGRPRYARNQKVDHAT